MAQPTHKQNKEYAGELITNYKVENGKIVFLEELSVKQIFVRHSVLPILMHIFVPNKLKKVLAHFRRSGRRRKKKHRGHYAFP